VLLQLQVDSDSEEKMGDELTILLEAFHKIEKAGGQATLSLSTSSGKTKVKLGTSTTAAPPSVSPSQPASSTPGRRHRRRGARARARRNLRAAAHQASLAEAATSVPPDPPRPLQLHPCFWEAESDDRGEARCANLPHPQCGRPSPTNTTTTITNTTITCSTLTTCSTFTTYTIDTIATTTYTAPILTTTQRPPGLA